MYTPVDEELCSTTGILPEVINDDWYELETTPEDSNVVGEALVPVPVVAAKVWGEVVTHDNSSHVTTTLVAVNDVTAVFEVEPGIVWELFEPVDGVSSLDVAGTGVTELLLVGGLLVVTINDL